MIEKILPYALTFAAVFVLDFVWAFYVDQVKERRAWSAAAWAGLLFLVSAFATVSYVDNHWLIVPAVAGAVMGTWAGVVRLPKK